MLTVKIYFGSIEVNCFEFLQKQKKSNAKCAFFYIHIVCLLWKYPWRSIFNTFENENFKKTEINGVKAVLLLSILRPLEKKDNC